MTARQKCPGLIVVPANFQLYLRFAKLAKEIYGDYTDQVESFGIDEAWLDVTGRSHSNRMGQEIADEIRKRLKAELGLTVSVGVSWNKIFAKLGSDLKKPDATTVIDKGNYKEVVWPLPVNELLYVGRSTQQKLYNRRILTIGDLANAEPTYLRQVLGKWGEILGVFANGYDESPVSVVGDEEYIKSIGNSATAYRDLSNEEDVKMMLTVLSESVAMRLRECGLKCQTVAIQIRDNQLFSFTRQQKLPEPTHVSQLIIQSALALFQRNYSWSQGIRSIGVKAVDLVPAYDRQIKLFRDEGHARKEKLESTIDDLRRRFGNQVIVKGTVIQDPVLTNFDPKTQHIIHPLSYFK